MGSPVGVCDRKMDLTLSPTDGTAANRQICPAISNLTPGLPADPGLGPAGRQAPRPWPARQLEVGPEFLPLLACRSITRSGIRAPQG